MEKINVKSEFKIKTRMSDSKVEDHLQEYLKTFGIEGSNSVTVWNDGLQTAALFISVIDVDSVEEIRNLMIAHHLYTHAIQNLPSFDSYQLKGLSLRVV